ncbi:hypothetical protein D9613_007721 [Agrocybe pediades]|uniref:NAD-dependent epimerase/dehydratase domain-containing protein n=1 Tax=Agrocybe pediades TaxID=84607 RepID=A0A8H4QMC8_9AGAR|nr:hypothetical protein D9613_007721 [Agrocybe pediades]
MKITVTGCNGRVGRRVVKLALERGNIVTGIDVIQPPFATAEEPWFDSPAFTFKQADLQDFESVLDVLAGSDAVINLAACPDPGDYKVKSHNDNVVISWNILRSCAELGIKRVAQASSVNVITLVYSTAQRLHYFPIDESHPCEPDDPYGLSKVICEMQADTIVRRYTDMTIASLRLHWTIPDRSMALGDGDSSQRLKDLWGYVQRDSAAHAFLLSIEDNGKWNGHERYFITAPHTAADEDTAILIQRYFPDVPIKEGKEIQGKQSLFDCSKAAALLDWHHVNDLPR